MKIYVYITDSYTILLCYSSFLCYSHYHVSTVKPLALVLLLFPVHSTNVAYEYDNVNQWYNNSENNLT